MKNNVKFAGLIAVVFVIAAAALAFETWKFSVFAEHFGWHPSNLVLVMIWLAQLVLVLANVTLRLITPDSRPRRPIRY